MKKTKIFHFGLTLILVLSIAFGIAACTTQSPQTDATATTAAIPLDESATDEGLPVSDETVAAGENDDTAMAVESTETDAAQLLANGLTETEVQGLLYMVEEEKLARDVYLTLYDLWQMNIFQNIAASEQTHIDSVKLLLDQYDIQNPIGDDVVGIFQNTELQTLYDQLITRGSQSLAEALNVGAAIEEIDILDLQDYIAQTTHADIQLVYENLTQGSENHLRSFVSTISRQTGNSYEPQYLPVEQFEEILNSSNGTGNGQGSGRP